MAVGTVATRGRAARRRWSQTALGSWVTTADHKRIGIMYIYTGIFFFFIGGIEAAAHSHAAGAARRYGAQPGGVRSGLHDARDDHDLPVRHADVDGLRQLPRAADDRRARHGLPAAQRAGLLAAVLLAGCSCTAASCSARRRTRAGSAMRRSPRRRPPAWRIRWATERCRRRRSSRPTPPPRAAPDASAPVRTWTSGSSASTCWASPRSVGAHQLHRHHPAHARAGHDHQPHAALRLDDDDHLVPAGLRAAQPDRRQLLPAVRPPPRHALLSGRRWAVIRCSGSTSSGRSATRRCTC